jgi:hypothetical protein
MLASRVLFFVSVALVSALLPARAAGTAPVAEAGLGLIAYVDDTVILDGSGSSDAEGDPLTYAWTQVGGPPVELDDPTSPKPRFTVAAAGTLRFALVVSDDLTPSTADTVQVIVPYEQVDGVKAGCAALPAVPGPGGALLGVLLGVGALVARRRSAAPGPGAR